MKKIIMLSAVTRRERHAAARVVFDTINMLDGWVEDTTLFSNKMSKVRLVIAFDRFPELFDLQAGNGISACSLPAVTNPATRQENAVAGVYSLR